MDIRTMEGKVLRDDRKFYLFTLPDKRKVETKAHTEEEARKIIETILDLKLAA